MSSLIELENPRAAQAFIDYLALKQVRCRLVESGTRYRIELLDEHKRPQAELELSRFLANPDAPCYHQASWQRAETKTVAFNYVSSGSMLLANFLRHAGPVTITTFVLTAVIYLLMLLGMEQDLFAALHFPQPFSFSEPWRIVTPILLHFSPIHILFNLLWWWYLGGMIEKKQGQPGLLLLMLISGIASNVSQYLVSGANFGGLSGVVYALMGYIWWSRLFRPERGLLLPTPYVNFMLVWLVIGFFQPFGMHIANTAHLSGLIAGCVLALVPIEWAKRSR